MIVKLRDHKPDLGVLAFLGLLVCVFFWKAVFLAEPISKVYLLGKRDVLFRKYYTLGQCGFDESVYLLLAPYYRLIAHYWRSYQMPLWNPYCGWGLPLLGDIQAAVFSPFRIFFALNPTMYQFNLLIVFEVFVAVSGTYVLARHLRLGKMFSILAALSYGFCPYFLYFIELLSGTTSALLPWLFWLFIRQATRPTRPRAMLCSAGCAVFIASGHPESSFVGVTFATLAMLLIFSFNNRIWSGLRWTAGIAGLALCFAAPVILPFLEYLRSADCYKFGHTPTALTPTQGLLLNLLQPLYSGASPYLGFLSLAFVLLSFFVQGEKRAYILSFLIGTFVCFICICRPLFFGPLFNMTPAGLVPGIYCAPAFLIQLSILGAVGAGYFVDHLKVGINRAFIVFISGILVTCFLPAVLNLCAFPFQSGNFDNGVADMAFNSRNWLVTMALSLSVVVLLFLKNKSKFPVFALTFSVVAMSFGSQCLASKQSLPNQPHFNYDSIEPLPFLEQKGQRVLTLGFDVLSPNTNVVYQIASVGTHNVMEPARYIKFMVAGGANWTTFNTVFDKVPLSNMLDYSGIKYVVSLAPVYGQRDAAPALAKVNLLQEIGFRNAATLKLKEAAVFYDQRKAEARGRLKFDLPESAIKRYHYSVVVLDEKGNPLWYGGLSPMRAIGRNNWALSAEEKEGYVPFSALVPLSMKPGQRFFLGLQIFDSQELKFLEPVLVGAEKGFGSVFCLSEHAFVSPDRQGSDLHYRLVSESGPQKIRVYENTLTLGRAYLVFSSQRAASAQEALEKFSSKSFDGFSQVVLEGDAGGSQPPFASETVRGVSVPLKLDTPNRLEMDVDSPKDGYLVLTDTYFPGWTATVDGQPVEIRRANYLFRAIAIKAGRHRVVFSYQPLSLTVSLLMFLVGLSICVFLFWKKDRN